MSLAPPSPSRTQRATLLLIVNLVAFLVPPIHWAFAGGDAVLAIGYFVVTGLLTVVTLLVLAPRADDADSAEAGR